MIVGEISVIWDIVACFEIARGVALGGGIRDNVLLVLIV